MNKADFTDLLKNPDKLGNDHIDTLRKIVVDYPFFSTAHILLAKALSNTNHYEYEKQLKVAALVTGDRSLLHQFITQNTVQEEEGIVFNVPLELKVEKLSKPDFEISEQEEAEAKNLIADLTVTEELVTDTEVTEPTDLIPENAEAVLADEETALFIEEVVESEIQTPIADTEENAREEVAQHWVAESTVETSVFDNEVLTTENNAELSTISTIETNIVEAEEPLLTHEAIEGSVFEQEDDTEPALNLVELSSEQNTIPEEEEIENREEVNFIEEESTVSNSAFEESNLTEIAENIETVVTEVNTDEIVDELKETIVYEAHIRPSEEEEKAGTEDTETEEVNFIEDESTASNSAFEESNLTEIAESIETGATEVNTDEIVDELKETIVYEAHITPSEEEEKASAEETETEEANTLLEFQKEEKTFQLVETEGTLVRFKGNFSEEILQHFDEESLQEGESNIETVTKSVIAGAKANDEVLNTAPIDDTESENTVSPLEADPIVEYIVEPHLSAEIPLEEAIADAEIEEELPVPAVEPAMAVTLDQLLEKYEEVLDEEPVFAESVESDAVNEVIFAESDIENNTISNITEPLTPVADTPANEGLSFMDWLNRNKLSAESNTNTTSSVTNSANKEEEDDFTLYIKQLIKTKANNALAKEIENQTQFVAEEHKEKEEEYKVEPVTAAFELPDVDPRMQVAEEMEVEPAFTAPVETLENALVLKEEEEDGIFDEIEAFEVNNAEKITSSNAETIEIEAIPPAEELVIPEIYSGEVVSILPDFDKLTIANEATGNDTFFTFNESTDLGIETLESTIDGELVEKEEMETEANTDFDIPAVFDNALFEQTFVNAFPTVASNLNAAQSKEQPKIVAPKIEVESILEKFMRDNPSITRPKAEFFNPANVAKVSAEDKDEIVSETLASIYLKQGLVKKAILTYEKLSLIYPHKITYFAALIKQLKTEHNIN